MLTMLTMSLLYGYNDLFVIIKGHKNKCFEYLYNVGIYTGVVYLGCPLCGVYTTGHNGCGINPTRRSNLFVFLVCKLCYERC